MIKIIRDALQLPPDTEWPPDHWTLIGISAGEASPQQIELAVMERIGRLRNYQLAHPDEVTEAMNRLARALVELTRPTTTVEPNIKSITSPTLEVAPEPPAIVRNSPRFPFRKKLEVAPEPPAIVSDLITEIVEPAEVMAPALELLPESFVATTEETTRRPLEELRKSFDVHRPWIERQMPVQDLPDVARPYPVAPGSRKSASSPRRAALRELVRFRRLLRAWDVAGTFLAQPEIVAMTRAESIAVLVALNEIEAAKWPLNEARPGGAVLTLARSRPNVGALWELPYNSRDSLRHDWQAGRLRLVLEIQRARQKSTRPRPWRTLQRTWRSTQQYVPQAAAAVVGIAAAVTAVVRLFV